MFLAHDYVTDWRPPRVSHPAILIERYPLGELGSLSEAGFSRLLDFLGRLFDLEVRERSAKSATLILFEKVELGIKPDGLLLVCKKEKVRDRILARLLEHREEWAAEVGPLRYRLHEGYWTDRHTSLVGISTLFGVLAMGAGSLSLGGIYLGEEGTPESASFVIFLLAGISLWYGGSAAGPVWTLLRWRSGKTPFPAHLELTERRLTGIVRERAFRGPLCSEIELGEIEKIWFMTVRSRSTGGVNRKNFRWEHRYDPFGVLGDEEITGLRIRAAGRTHVVWADRLELDSAIRDLSTALQQSVRERLFPEPA